MRANLARETNGIVVYGGLGIRPRCDCVLHRQDLRTNDNLSIASFKNPSLSAALRAFACELVASHKLSAIGEEGIAAV